MQTKMQYTEKNWFYWPEHAGHKFQTGDWYFMTIESEERAKYRRLFFAMLDTVYQSQAGPDAEFKSRDNLRDVTLLEIGFTKLIQQFDGTRVMVPRSMAAGKVKKAEWLYVIEQSIDVWCRHFGLEESDLKKIQGEYV